MLIAECAQKAAIYEQMGDYRQALLQTDHGTARATSEAIHQAVEDFVGAAEPSDDLTKMCIIMN